MAITQPGPEELLTFRSPSGHIKLVYYSCADASQGIVLGKGETGGKKEKHLCNLDAPLLVSNVAKDILSCSLVLGTETRKTV